jgi:uncharacterized protein (TIGR03084 family)
MRQPLKTICADLNDEYVELDGILADLGEEQWNLPTPFLSWRIKDEIRHLAYFDERAAQAATDPDAFGRHLAQVTKDFAAFENSLHEMARGLSPSELMQGWRQKRRAMLDALLLRDKKDRLPWYGPPMSALSFATARLMETWAHGQDIVDTLRIRRFPTDRLRHIAHLGVTTFGWTYLNRGLKPPQAPVRVELYAPSGDIWSWGPAEAENRILGSAEDFCLVVVQRRNVADTALAVAGKIAGDWMKKAQCFAGPPADGPKAGQRRI